MLKSSQASLIIPMDVYRKSDLVKDSTPYDDEDFRISKRATDTDGGKTIHSSNKSETKISRHNTQIPTLIESINTEPEKRRKSTDLGVVDPLHKEVFSQTLIYAAKETLATLHSDTESIEQKPEEFKEQIKRRLSNSARRPSKRFENDHKGDAIDNSSRRSSTDSESEHLSEAKKSNNGEQKSINTSNAYLNVPTTDVYRRRRSSVKDVTEYTKMAEKKKTSRRKESFILVPIKDMKGLTLQQIEEIKKSFNDLDVNKDGRISRRELIMGAYRLGMNPTDAEVDEMMKSTDTNNDGFIDFNEYVNMMKTNYVTIDIERERMKAAFAMLDNDGDGYLSKKELTAALVTSSSGITVEDVEEILRDADMDGNDRIDFNEFVDSTICSKLF